MDCYRHPGAAAVATCIGCRQPICPECREEVAGHPMCHPCVAAAATRLSTESDSPAAAATPATEQATATPSGSLAPASPAPEYAAAGAPLAAPIPLPGPPIDGVPPGLARRIVRGMGWGVLYGQWWTLWRLVSAVLWGQASLDTSFIVYMVVSAVVFGAAGSLTGIIIGASNASETTGTAIGVGAGIVLCLLQVLLFQSAAMLISLFFYFITGRYVGGGITGRVQQLLPSKGRVSDAATI